MNYTILRTPHGQSHAFRPGQAENLREAACGELVLGVLLQPSPGPVPTCAMALGAQVEKTLSARAHAVQQKIADAVATAAADEIDALIASADRLDGPARTTAIRVLAGRSRAVRVWVRWSSASSVLMPLGMACLGVGIWDLTTAAVPVWTLLALLCGTVALTVNVVGLWRAAHHAQQLAIGLQLKIHLHDDHHQRPGPAGATSPSEPGTGTTTRTYPPRAPRDEQNSDRDS